ncbi:hypothetical protein, partial [Sporisorium scitamineum]
MDEDDDDEPSGLAGARKRRAKLARREAKKAGAKKDAPKARAISDGMALSVVGSSDEELGLFHPEDIVISKFASNSLTYRFPPPPDASDSFEAPLFGRVALVPAEKMDALLQQIEADLSMPMPQ